MSPIPFVSPIWHGQKPFVTVWEMLLTSCSTPDDGSGMLRDACLTHQRQKGVLFPCWGETQPLDEGVKSEFERLEDVIIRTARIMTHKRVFATRRGCKEFGLFSSSSSLSNTNSAWGSGGFVGISNLSGPSRTLLIMSSWLSYALTSNIPGG